MLLDKTGDEKATKNKIAIGIELRNDFSQISYCMLNQSVPDTYSMVAGREEYNVPTVLCKVKDKQEYHSDKWLFGREAIDVANNREGYLVEDLILLAKNQTSIEVDEKEYPIDLLLSLFIKKCLLAIVPSGKLEDIISIAFTLKDLDDKVMQVLKTAVSQIPRCDVKVTFMSHQDCFYQYLIHQPREMWLHDVVLYDYREEGIISYYFHTNNQVTPCVCFMEKDFFPQMRMNEISSYSNEQRDAYLVQLDETFMEINHKMCDEKQISAVFLLGDLFANEWCKQSIKFLCKQGRVFQGTNLFSKGACYGARELVLPSTLIDEFCFLSEEKLKCNIGILCHEMGKDTTKTLLKAGMNWYEARADLDVILVKDNHISLVISPLDGENVRIAEITLEGFAARGNRTNRMGIHLEMTDTSTVLVEIKDKGFGDFFPSTGQVWRESFSVVLS